MAVSPFSSLLLLCGFIPCIFAGNQCSTQFPGRGYCIQRSQLCPGGSQEYSPLSNGMGCPNMISRCCVTSNTFQPRQDPAFNRTECGKGSLPLDSRIFNGINAGPCDWPFVVSIRSKRVSSSRLDYAGTTHLCAGVLIDRLWVLTSAVCILNAGRSVQQAHNEFIVVAGEYNISGIDISPFRGGQQEQIINVATAIIHPNYAYSHVDQIELDNPQRINSNSIGLIKLAQPINGECSGIVCLPSQREAEATCNANKNCIITGWGFISESYNPPQGARDKLKQGRVELASMKGCNLVVDRLGLKNTRPVGTLCQYPTNILTDGCLGDEGGAIMCSTGTNWVVRGILPFQMCSKTNFNLFVTDVSPYINWIKNTLARWGTYYTSFSG